MATKTATPGTSVKSVTVIQTMLRRAAEQAIAANAPGATDNVRPYVMSELDIRMTGQLPAIRAALANPLNVAEASKARELLSYAAALRATAAARWSLDDARRIIIDPKVAPIGTAPTVPGAPGTPGVAPASSSAMPLLVGLAIAAKVLL